MSAPSDGNHYEVEAYIPVTIILEGTGISKVIRDGNIEVSGCYRLVDDGSRDKRLKSLSREAIEVVTYTTAHDFRITAEPKDNA